MHFPGSMQLNASVTLVSSMLVPLLPVGLMLHLTLTWWS